MDKIFNKFKKLDKEKEKENEKVILNDNPGN
jgi:hypothetical protein